MKVHALVLAAGEGRRMGGPKHLLEVDGLPMLERVVRALCRSRVDSRTVVLRPGDAAGRALALRLDTSVVEVDRPEEGRAASIRSGVRHAPADVDALVFALADQPWLEAADFDALVGAHAGGAAIAYASYAGQRGTPVLFAARFRPALLVLRGEQGGRELIRRHPDVGVAVELPPERGRDVDRPADLVPVG